MYLPPIAPHFVYPSQNPTITLRPFTPATRAEASSPRGRDATRGRRTVVVVAPLRHELRVPHLGQFLVKDAHAVPAHDALQQFRRRHAGRAPRGEEFTCEEPLGDIRRKTELRGDKPEFLTNA